MSVQRRNFLGTLGTAGLLGLASPRDQKAQEQVARAYRDRDHWTRMSIINSASSGKFSTDRTITEYNNEIWHLKQVKPE
jgi:hypothetical protein